MSIPFFNSILLTNDDGINAPGLKILEDIASKLAHEVWVVAPERDQSGTSQSISIHDPLRVIQKDPRHFSVTGTPGDCVVMGAKEIMPSTPDLILSGINRGSNLGIETIFSGTVGAAMTGCLLNIPSIALSQNFKDGNQIHWDTARYHGIQILKKIFKKEWITPRTCLNINFPDCSPDKVKSLEFTSQGAGYIQDVRPVKKVDLRQNHYYWLDFDRPIKADKAGTETETINGNSISVTPLTFERTDWQLLNKLKE